MTSTKSRQVTRIRRIVHLLVWLVLLGALAGCSFRYGSPPRVDRLEALKVGVSTDADVLLTLGEPRGRGMSRFFPTAKSKRTIWFYEYLESNGSRVSQKFLLVFFDDNRYDGYFWFSAADLTTTKSIKGI